MPIKNSRVHAWLWDDDKTAYIFVGDADEPMRRFRSREEFESQLHDKLRSLKTEPANKGLDVVTYKERAKAIAITWVKRLVADGYRILSNRDRASHCGGRKDRKPCFVPTPWGLSWYPSVSAAARALKVNSSTISHKLNNRWNCDYVWDTPELSALNQQLEDALRSLLQASSGLWRGTPRELWAAWAADTNTYGDIASRWRTPSELCKSLSVRSNQLCGAGILVEIEGKSRITIEDLSDGC